MEPGYSRMLIHDTIVASRAPSMAVTRTDLAMLLLSSRERTEELWTDLLDKAELRIVRIWTSIESHESVIEAVRD